MISDPVYPGSGARALSKAISDDLLAYEAHRVDEFAEQGLGIDGMPLAPGQTGPKKRPAADLTKEILAQQVSKLREELKALRASEADAKAETELLRKYLKATVAALDIAAPGWRESQHADP